MSYTIKDAKEVSASAEVAYHAALKAIAGLEGKLQSEDVEAKSITAKFHKTIHGKVLGDRTQLEVEISSNNEHATVHATIFPLDAVGRKLMFGARKGVSKTVLSWFYAHLDHHLSTS